MKLKKNWVAQKKTKNSVPPPENRRHLLPPLGGTSPVLRSPAFGGRSPFPGDPFPVGDISVTSFQKFPSAFARI